MPDYLPIPRFPLPDVLTPVGTMCVRVTIPNDQQYLGTLIGLIDLLKWSRNFARDASGTGAATVSRTWKSALETSPIEIEGCDMPDFRINDETCLLEVNCGTDDDPNWRPVFTPDYDPSEDAPPPPSLYPDPPPSGESNACLAAANVTAMLQNGANNIRALLVDGAAFGAVLQNIFTFLSQVVTLIQAQLWPDFQVAYGNWNAATIQADYDAFNWDDLKNLLVCHFDEDGQINVVEFNEALNEVQANIPSSQIWSIISFALSAMGWIGTNLATRWGGIESADCASCEGCLWDFEIGGRAYTLLDGVVEAGVGIGGSRAAVGELEGSVNHPGNYQRIIRFEVTVLNAGIVTGITFSHKWHNTYDNYCTPWVRIFRGATVLYSDIVGITVPDGAWQQRGYIPNVAVLPGDKISIYTGYDNFPTFEYGNSGYVYLDEIILEPCDLFE